MGVQELHSLIRTKHPQLITTLRRRWSDPRIAGKRVAIDGTLVTNAFHLRSKESRIPGLEGKDAIVGWYQLINEMRAQGVQPIAIWDQKGSREWKAAEARKRLAQRQKNLSRYRNEVDRYNRLTNIEGLFDDFNKMTEVERNIFHQQWADMLLKNYHETVAAAEAQDVEIPSLSPPEGETLPNTPSIQHVRTSFKSTSEPLTEVEAQKSLDKVISFVDSFNEILEDYGQHYRPATTKKSQMDREAQKEMDREAQLAIEYAADLEVISGESATGGQISGPEAVYGQQESPIDETLQETAPVVNETKLQTELSKREGDLLQSFLVTPPDFPRTSPPILEGEGEVVHMAESARRNRLNELAFDAGKEKEKHHSHLLLPSAQDHQNCRDLLLRMGVPILEAVVPYEAEGLASALAKANLVDFVGTEDSDVLAYEAPLLRGVSGGKLVTVIGTEVREAFNLDSAAWLDFCILLGTDASSRIPQVGPARAYELIEEHGTIEEVLQSDNKHVQKLRDKEGFMRDVKVARKVFDLPPIPEGAILKDGVWDEAELDKWLEEVHGIRFEDELGDSLESPGQTPKDLVRTEASTSASIREVEEEFSWEVDIEDIKR